MTEKKRKTRKMTAGDTLITRAELQFFAKAVDARIAQAIGKLREELTPVTPAEDIPVGGYAALNSPTDSEGAE